MKIWYSWEWWCVYIVVYVHIFIGQPIGMRIESQLLVFQHNSLVFSNFGIASFNAVYSMHAARLAWRARWLVIENDLFIPHIWFSVSIVEVDIVLRSAKWIQIAVSVRRIFSPIGHINSLHSTKMVHGAKCLRASKRAFAKQFKPDWIYACARASSGRNMKPRMLVYSANCFHAVKCPAF